jgi:hypothetical protein
LFFRKIIYNGLTLKSRLVPKDEVGGSLSEIANFFHFKFEVKFEVELWMFVWVCCWRVQDVILMEVLEVESLN